MLCLSLCISYILGRSFSMFPFKKITTYILLSITLMLSFVSPVVASTNNTKENDAKEVLELNIENAVIIGIENSVLLDQVLNEIDLSEVSKKRAASASKKLDDGRKKLKDSSKELSLKEQEFEKVKDQLPPEVVTQMEHQLEIARQQLGQGDLKLIDAIQQAGGSLSDQLNFASLDSLSIDATSDLLTTMGDVAFEVTQASYDIYKNNIAMLIQKSYYDALHAQKMVEVKKRAMERGKKQYEFAKASYEEGLKPKDDMLMASVYYQGTQIEYEKAKGDFENTLLELKKNMNIPLDSEIKLTSVLAENIEEMNLEEGLLSGLTNRLEIKKTLGEVIVYDLNFTETKKKYTPNTFQYKEAELLQKKAHLNFDQTQLEVENSIRQSYRTVHTLGSMLMSSKEMIEEAKENVSISEMKYKEGFGVETSLLKQLNLESSAGTILEMLAAEENLAQIEEKVVQITYGYNLARMKYFNDIGYFIY